MPPKEKSKKAKPPPKQQTMLPHHNLSLEALWSGQKLCFDESACGRSSDAPHEAQGHLFVYQVASVLQKSNNKLAAACKCSNQSIKKKGNKFETWEETADDDPAHMTIESSDQLAKAKTT